MTILSLHRVVFLLLLIFTASRAAAQNGFERMLKDGIQENPDPFELVELEPKGTPSDFRVSLGESALVLEDGTVLDGLRFVAPPEADTQDFVWYLNVPSNWAHWYICPVKGEMGRAFRDWLTAIQWFQEVDDPDTDNRFRAFQQLDAGYFRPGEEYILWFRQVSPADGTLSGRIRFADDQEEWDYEDYEKQLAMKPFPPDVQIEKLGSVGGRILLDQDFFTPGYAAGRIKDVFFDIRHTRQFQGGFFITMETAVPPCTTRPPFDAIRARYGEPHFIQTDREKQQLLSEEGEEVEFDTDLTTFYYDYFGFEVSGGEEGRVVRVRTHAHDMSTLIPEGTGNAFGRVLMKNLTAFFHQGKEVGRLYYFLEGAKEPVVMKEPPSGSYKLDSEVLEYSGDGTWRWISLNPDDSVAREVRFENHRMHGEAKGFYANGQPTFTASYQNGRLHGTVTRYTEAGEVLEQTHYEQGVPKEKDAGNP